MSKSPKSRSRSKRGDSLEIVSASGEVAAFSPQLARTPFEPKNEMQRKFTAAIKGNTITFGIGPAGTGKTYVPVALAAQQLHDKRIEQIIITRPAQDVEEKLGFLPGELQDKYAPYFEPVRDVLYERLGKSATDYYVKNGRIIPKPLAHMRGKSYKNCWVILDEAQNTTPGQMKMLLSRIGENCKLIINGDPTQKDIQGPSGLIDAVRKLKGVKGIHFIRFSKDDIVRSGIVRDILERYERRDSEMLSDGEDDDA